MLVDKMGNNSEDFKNVFDENSYLSGLKFHNLRYSNLYKAPL